MADPSKRPSSKRGKWRFSLRSLLALTALAGIVIAVYVDRSRVNDAVRQLKAAGGTIEFHPASFQYWHRFTGNFFASAKSVDMMRQRVDDEQLRPLRYLSRLERLNLDNSVVTHEGIARLTANPNLEELSLSQCVKIDRRAIPELLRLKQLKRLNISETSIGGNQLRRLADIQHLEQLTFRAKHEHPMNTEDIQFVESLPKATATFQQYLSGIDDDDLLRMLAIDLSKNVSFIIRDSRFTRRSIEVLSQQKCWSIEFRECQLDGDAIAGLDWMAFEGREFRDDQPRVVFQRCDIQLAELVKHVAPVARDMRFYWSSRFKHLSVGFNATGYHHCVLLDGFSESELTTEALRPLVNLEFVAVGKTLAPRIFQWMIDTQPRIKLDIHYSDDLQPLWDAVEQTPSLTKLIVHADDFPSTLGTPKFTTQHRLKELSINLNGFSIDQRLLDEITKLTQLEQLRLYHGLAPGSEIAKLRSLPRLNKVTIIPALTRNETLDAMTSMGFVVEPRHRWHWTKLASDTR